MAKDGTELQRALPLLAGGVRNAFVRVRNAAVGAIPGERPRWLVVELAGSYPTRRSERKLISLPSLLGSERNQSQEEFSAQITSLLAAPWLEGVVARFGELRLDLTTAYALRRELLRLRAGGKQVIAYVTDLNAPVYYLASAAGEIVSPESASVQVHGMALSTTFMAEALNRLGIRFEKLAIDEFKNAGDQLVLPAMSGAQRLQYDALLDSLERTYLEAVASERRVPPSEVRSWIDRGVTSATEAGSLGMIDRVGYEDEIGLSRPATFRAARRYLPVLTTQPGGRVAVVSLEGTIVPGRSRRTPLPLPLLGDTMAGSETVVAALRTAAADSTTAALVFHVDSGGGSALASDLIWREVKLIAARMPVVAVMGSLAASGGYYVLTHASRIVAAPTTLTGSIGVLMAKIVLEEFNARYGFNPETLARGRYAAMNGSARGWDAQERELLGRYNREIYERFVARVADGRRLDRERVDELGRGRVWSGADALELGLVDELGDMQLAIARAKELAGLPQAVEVWNVPTKRKLVLPLEDAPETLLSAWAPLLRESALLMHARDVRLA